MANKYIDIEINNIVKQLDSLFIDRFGYIENPNMMKCKHCGVVAHKDNFTVKYVSWRSNKRANQQYIIDICKDCTDYRYAKTALHHVVSVYLNTLDTYTYNGSNDPFLRKVQNKIVTPEIIKIKTILDKLTKKLKDYDASKH
jgi:hypothetical protein